MDHAPEPHTPHSHGHAHPHTHDHGHDHHHDHGAGDYYLQQLLTVFICGAFGVAGVLMYLLPSGVTDDNGAPVTKLGILLSPGFHVWVLAGSLLLLAATLVRGVALWRSVGAGHHGHDHAHDHHHHDHKPGEECDHPSHAHDHGHHHHPHDHDHGDHTAEDHSHGNIYWRVVLLLFPIVILVMGLPNGTFSTKYLLTRAGGTEVGQLGDVADRGTTDIGFEALANAAYSEASREAYTGKTATVNGQFKRLSDTQFTLFFFKQTCCAADQVPLKATCVVKPEDKAMLSTWKKVKTEGGQEMNVPEPIPDGQKVSVTGRIQFVESGGEWVTVLRVDKGGLKKR